MKMKQILEMPSFKKFSRKKITEHPYSHYMDDAPEMAEEDKGRYTFMQYVLKEQLACPFMDNCEKLEGLSGDSWRNAI